MILDTSLMSILAQVQTTTYKRNQVPKMMAIILIQIHSLEILEILLIFMIIINTTVAITMVNIMTDLIKLQAKLTTIICHITILIKTVFIA